MSKRQLAPTRLLLPAAALVAAIAAATGPGAASGSPRPVSFAQNVEFAVGQSPNSVSVGDLNGDGAPDLAVANSNSQSVSVLLGDGAGSFGANTEFATVQPDTVTLGDLNGDGIPDVAIAGDDTAASVLLGDGTGAFGARTDFGANPDEPVSIAAGDLNGDGKLDLVAANLASCRHSVSVLLGDGSGSFATHADYPAGSGAISVAIAELNGDGNRDFVVANANEDAVSVLLGDGTGSFQPRSSFATGVQPWSVAVGDLNSDGHPDLAVANHGAGSVWNTFVGSKGSFTLKLRGVTGPLGSPVHIATADWAVVSGTGAYADLAGGGLLQPAQRSVPRSSRLLSARHTQIN
jgi:hypothetical protein